MADRSVLAVPRPVLALLALAFCLQVGMQAIRPAPAARAQALATPPSPAIVRVASLDEPIAAAQLMTLYLQAFDNQPGLSIPFQELDYPRVIDWLEAILALDATGQYPLLMASQLYAQVPIEDKQRLMLDFVHRKFSEDPQLRWRWLAHATILAKHRLKDNGLALRYAGHQTGHARCRFSFLKTWVNWKARQSCWGACSLVEKCATPMKFTF
jgi:hypothetical protein